MPDQISKRRVGTRVLIAAALFCIQTLPVCGFTAFQNSGVEIITLSHDPGPDELVLAKQELAAGKVVMMVGADVAQFDGLLNVGLPFPGQAFTLDQQGRDKDELRLMAARVESDGSLHSYECFTPSGYQDTGNKKGKNCMAALDAWIQQDGLDTSGSALPEPLPADWTALGRPDATYFDSKGNKLEDRIRLYRVNDDNFDHDWYLIVRDPLSVPNYYQQYDPLKHPFRFGWLTYLRDFQISLDRALAAPDNGFSMYEWSPANPVGKTTISFSIAFSLDGVVPTPGVGISFAWEQPWVSTAIYTAAQKKEVSWVESFSPSPLMPSPTPNSGDPFISHNGVIFQVPEGTTAFDVNLYSFFKSGFAGFVYADWAESTERRTLHVPAPVFSATPASVQVPPDGQAIIFVNAGVPTYSQGLKWTAQASDGFSISPDQGNGSGYITVTATSATVGQTGTLQLQTNPPFAAPSVARSPLKVILKVGPQSPPRGVLLAGGVDWTGRTLDSAEIWDPATRLTTPVGTPMITPRRQHTATLVTDGRILITGGFDDSSRPQKSAQLYDPALKAFTNRIDMNSARADHTATLLTRGPLAGDVLIAGGCCDANNKALKTAELYDPNTNTFIATGPLRVARMDQTATLLADGRVLITGGTGDRNSYEGIREAEIYDPATQSFSLTGSMNTGRQGHSGTLLENGQVLVTGGWNIRENPIRSAELYTPASGAFTYTPDAMKIGRRFQATTLLPSGEVLIDGGFNYTVSAEIYNPNSDAFSFTSNFMGEERDRPTATLLLNSGTSIDGQVLIAGGVLSGTGSTGGKQLELWSPAAQAFLPAGTMTTPRTYLTATQF